MSADSNNDYPSPAEGWETTKFSPAKGQELYEDKMQLTLGWNANTDDVPPAVGWEPSETKPAYARLECQHHCDF